MDASKRKSLNGLFGVGAIALVLPDSWVKPIIASVITPTHAQTSNFARSNLKLVGGKESFFWGGDAVNGEIRFVSGTINTSGNTAFLEIKYTANNISEGSAEGWAPVIDGSCIRSAGGDEVCVGTFQPSYPRGGNSTICHTSESNPIIAFTDGLNSIDIEYPVSRGKHYIRLSITLSAISCGPYQNPTQNFEIDIQT